MVMRYRYSEWDGTQEIPPLDPDEVLNALTDDLMNFGDLQHALRNLMQRGMRNQTGDRTQGLRDLLQQLRQQRRQTLDRFNLSSAFDDIQSKLEDILARERETLERRKGDASPGETVEPQDGSGEGSEGEEGADGEPGQGEQSGARSPRGQSGQQSAAGQQGGGQGQGGEQQGHGGARGEHEWAEVLRTVVER
jgi:hypothetical protein